MVSWPHPRPPQTQSWQITLTLANIRSTCVFPNYMYLFWNETTPWSRVESLAGCHVRCMWWALKSSNKPWLLMYRCQAQRGKQSIEQDPPLCLYHACVWRHSRASKEEDLAWWRNSEAYLIQACARATAFKTTPTVFGQNVGQWSWAISTSPDMYWLQMIISFPANLEKFLCIVMQWLYSD